MNISLLPKDILCKLFTELFKALRAERPETSDSLNFGLTSKYNYTLFLTVLSRQKHVDYAIDYYCHHGHIYSLKKIFELLPKKYTPSCFTINSAIKNGSTEIAKLIIMHPNYDCTRIFSGSLGTIARRGYVQIFELLFLPDKLTQTHYASIKNWLIEAVIAGHIRLVKLLVTKITGHPGGTSSCESKKEGIASQSFVNTLLRAAIAYHDTNLKIVKYLLNQYVININLNFNILLYDVIQYNSKSCLQLYLKHTSSKITIAHINYAKNKGHYAIAKILKKNCSM